MKTALCQFLLIMLVLITFPISIPILIFSNLGGGNKSQQPAPPKNENNEDGYDKIFPYIFTDEDSSDEEKLLEDLYIMDNLDDDNK